MTSGAWSNTSPAHPRSRGENHIMRHDRFTTPGSSPLTRGKRHRECRRWHCLRLIPAHAGKTVASKPATLLPLAHPRSRGENKERHGEVIAAQGSSPLTRGKLDGRHPGVCSVRLIPAHAGKTASSAHSRTSRPAHPRSRGENLLVAAVASCVWGSSPLTRGKHPRPGPHAHPRRLIPAHAGKTNDGDLLLVTIAAHPRSRGENTS